jgi:hypothetical protein
LQDFEKGTNEILLARIAGPVNATKVECNAQSIPGVVSSRETLWGMHWVKYGVRHDVCRREGAVAQKTKAPGHLREP